MNSVDPTRRRLLLGASSALALANPAWAQQAFPSKTVRILVPFPAGGAGDIAVRMVAKPLATALGVPVVVDNRPGGDGVIAVQELLRAPADGHTLMFGTPSALLYVPLTNSKPPYDALKDLDPVSHFSSFTYFVYVSDEVPVKTLEELIAYARRNPGKLAYGTGDSTQIVAMAQICQHAGLDMVHVPYKGTTQVITDFVGGRLQIMVSSVEAIDQTRGKARPMAVLLPRRSSLKPEVPTFAEAGLRQVTLRPWTGFFAAGGTPRPLLERLSSAMSAVFKQPDLVEFFAVRGSVLESSTPEALHALLVEQTPVWRDAIRFAKILIQ